MPAGFQFHELLTHRRISRAEPLADLALPSAATRRPTEAIQTATSCDDPRTCICSKHAECRSINRGKLTRDTHAHNTHNKEPGRVGW